MPVLCGGLILREGNNMLLGVMGDIHANFEALTAIYGKLKEVGCDKIISLGDSVGYGASPGGCIDFMRREKIIGVKGNHDDFLLDKAGRKSWELGDCAREAIIWSRTQLNSEQLHWLAGLPFALEFEECCFVHASLAALDGEYWPYILDRKTAEFHFYLQKPAVAFCGHLHIPLLFTRNSDNIVIEMLKSIKLEQHQKYLICPGAVGQPRDADWRAAAVVFDTASLAITPVRVEYDVDSAKQKIINAGLPEVLAERLSQ